MPGRRNPLPIGALLVVAASLVAGCSADRRSTLDSLAPSPPASALPGTAPAPAEPSAPATPTNPPQPTTLATSPPTAPTSAPAATPTPAPETTPPAEPVYVFPFVGKHVSYHRTHHDYPAADVFGCGADVVAPTAGRIDEISLDDRWDPAINDPATRGGKFVSLVGNDGVRYYFAHLDSVAVAVGDTVPEGAELGVMGQTGNARNSACHTHFGISWVCDGAEWQVRRGEVWPWRYLDAWRDGEQKSPSIEILVAEDEHPEACVDALASMPAAPAPDALTDSTLD